MSRKNGKNKSKIAKKSVSGSSSRKPSLTPAVISPLPSNTSSNQGVVLQTALDRPAVFSDEPEAIARRDAVDYTVRIALEDARAGRAKRVIRIYADGVYDMFHSGHARQLMQAKAAFPGCQVYLIVGVCSAESTHRYKGQTVMSEHERYEMVRHCRYVDEVYRDAPWVTDMAFMRRLKIDFVAHDDIPYASVDSDDVYKWLKDADMFLATERTEGISTTDVITRIIRDYNTYIRRNLKRGYSRQELNVGYVKEKQLKIYDKVESVRNRANHLLVYWENKSVKMIHDFIGIFERNGSVRRWLRNKSQQ